MVHLQVYALDKAAGVPELLLQSLLFCCQVTFIWEVGIEARIQWQAVCKAVHILSHL